MWNNINATFITLNTRITQQKKYIGACGRIPKMHFHAHPSDVALSRTAIRIHTLCRFLLNDSFIGDADKHAQNN